jgi:hypothetical protein
VWKKQATRPPSRYADIVPRPMGKMLRHESGEPVEPASPLEYTVALTCNHYADCAYLRRVRSYRLLYVRLVPTPLSSVSLIGRSR